MSYKVSMMYYGSRLRPVEEVVSEAMEAEDFSVVNHYLTFLLAHACDTQDYRLRRQCDLIKTAHGKPPFKGAPASSNNLPQQHHPALAAVAPNQIFIKNYNGKPIDFEMLRKLLYDCYVANVRFKYDWYAPYKFFNDIRILNDTGLKPFAKQMNTWYKELADSYKCDAEALSDWNCGYTCETHYNLWKRDAFLKNRIGKKQTDKGFQRLLTHIIALKEQFKTIPVITNSENNGDSLTQL